MSTVAVTIFVSMLAIEKVLPFAEDVVEIVVIAVVGNDAVEVVETSVMLGTLSVVMKLDAVEVSRFVGDIINIPVIVFVSAVLVFLVKNFVVVVFDIVVLSVVVEGVAEEVIEARYLIEILPIVVAVAALAARRTAALGVSNGAVIVLASMVEVSGFVEIVDQIVVFAAVIEDSVGFEKLCSETVVVVVEVLRF